MCRNSAKTRLANLIKCSFWIRAQTDYLLWLNCLKSFHHLKKLVICFTFRFDLELHPAAKISSLIILYCIPIRYFFFWKIHSDYHSTTHQNSRGLTGKNTARKNIIYWYAFWHNVYLEMSEPRIINKRRF